MTARVLRSCLALPLLLAACNPPAPSSANPTSGSAMVGSGGGTVVLSDGTGVTIPAGAVTTSITVTATEFQESAPAGSTLTGSAVTFGPEGQHFAEPVTVTLAFNATLLPTGWTASDVVVFTAPHGSTSYTKLPTTVVDASHVAALTNHFSDFLPAALPPPPDAGQPDSGTPTDAGPTDSGTPADAGMLDAGMVDAGTADAGATDAGSTDAGMIDAGSTDAGTDGGGTASDAG